MQKSRKKERGKEKKESECIMHQAGAVNRDLDERKLLTHPKGLSA